MVDSIMIRHGKEHGCLFTITIDDPLKLNSLSFEGFSEIARLLDMADQDREVVATVIQSTGGFFSAGGKFESISAIDKEGARERENRLRSEIAAMNVYVADAFARHSKLLVCSLNGPAIGLAASLVLLCDLVYAMNDSVYLLLPFTSLGFVAELGCSVTVPSKLGINRANEHFFFSTKIGYDEMVQARMISQNFDLPKGSTDEFNRKVQQLLSQSLEGNNRQAILDIKRLLNSGDALVKAQSRETNTTLPFWLQGVPFKRFKQLQSRQRKHRL